MNAERTIDDATLSAWLDGALERDQFESVQKALESSPDLQQRLNVMLLNERTIKKHYCQMATERPVPQAILTMLDSGIEHSSKSWLSVFKDWLAELHFGPGLVAAGVAGALVVGALIGQQALFEGTYVSSVASVEWPRIDEEHDWYALLESTGSGEKRALPGNQFGLVTLSYQNAEGAWCRQFEVHKMDQEEGTAAVACRRDGQWQIELAQRVEQPAAEHGHFEVAGAAERAALDAYIMQNSQGDAIVGEAESALISRGWR